MTVQYDKLIDIERLGAFKGMCDDEYAAGTHTHSYAGAPTSGGNADRSNAILFGSVDATSTATAFTATVAGLDALADGTAVYLRNHVVTSAAGFTVDVNGFGAKKCYNNMTNATQDTTIFNIAYSMLFIYDSSLDEGNGGWWIYRGYDGNTNTIGYQVRTNSGRKPAADKGYRYRIWLTSADGASWVPINTSTATDATTARTLNTRKIDPFGPIAYNSTNGTCNAAANLPAATMWRVYTLTIGYSYVKTLTVWDPVYLKCTPQADGSAVMNDIVQALPASKDGYIYIHLGTAYSATSMELQTEHPVYWHDGTGIRIWTGAEPSGGSSVEPSSTTPAMDGTAAVGTATTYARADHVHPTDTSRQAALVSGTNIKTVNNESLLGSGNISISGGGTTTWYGTCATADGTATKVVTCSGFTLKAGAIITVKFTYKNSTVGALKLNVNNTGAVNIKPDGFTMQSLSRFFWIASELLTFMYDGSAFICLSRSKPKTCFFGKTITSAADEEKIVTCAGYYRELNGLIAVYFQHGSTSDNLKLNIDGMGLMPAAVDNYFVSSSNPLTINAGETVLFVYAECNNGSAYNAIRTPLPSSATGVSF